MLVAVIIVAIVVIAGLSLLVPSPRAKLTVTDGSITGTIEGDFFSIDWYHWMYSYFNATSLAHQSGHPTSNLTLQVVALTHWDDSFGVIETAFLITVLGDLDSNLSARELRIACNQTAYHTSVGSLGTLRGANVSFYPNVAKFDFWNNDSGSLTVKLVNRTGSDPHYRFSCQVTVSVSANPYASYGVPYDLGVRFVGIRATIDGWFEPEFSVGMLFKIVNTSTSF
jgi:hypothetical protein